MSEASIPGQPGEWRRSSRPWSTILRYAKRYEYPRYFFTNKSDDIRKLCTDTLAEVGVRWTVLARGSDPFNVSIARKESVALMDAHIGPKH